MLLDRSRLKANKASISSDNSTSIQASLPRSTIASDESATLVDSKASCDLSSVSLHNIQLIAVDCEFSMEEVVLVQVAATTQTGLTLCFLFDLLCADRQTVIATLKNILEDVSITKIVHDCRRDTALLHKLGITLVNVVDTQVGHSIMSQMARMYGCEDNER